VTRAFVFARTARAAPRAARATRSAAKTHAPVRAGKTFIFSYLVDAWVARCAVAWPRRIFLVRARIFSPIEFVHSRRRTHRRARAISLGMAAF
jgi:hypothetical protein